jgi:thioredoxin
MMSSRFPRTLIAACLLLAGAASLAACSGSTRVVKIEITATPQVIVQAPVAAPKAIPLVLPTASSFSYRNDRIDTLGESGLPGLIMFHSPGCYTCEEEFPIVDGVATEYEGKVDFYVLRIEAPDSQTLVRKYGVRGIPTFLLVSPDGDKIAEWSGLLTADVLRRSIDAYWEAHG